MSGGSWARPSGAIRTSCLTCCNGAHRPGSARAISGAQDNAEFIAAFIHGRKAVSRAGHRLLRPVERTPAQSAWIKVLRKTLDARGLAQVKIIAADECDGRAMWNIGQGSARRSRVGRGDPCPRRALSALAFDGGVREDWQAAVRQRGRSLAGRLAGRCTLAKAFNRNYIVGRMTKTVIWSLISSYYDILPLPELRADEGPRALVGPLRGAAGHLGHRPHHAVRPARLEIPRLRLRHARGPRQLRGVAQSERSRLQHHRRDG